MPKLLSSILRLMFRRKGDTSSPNTTASEHDLPNSASGSPKPDIVYELPIVDVIKRKSRTRQKKKRKGKVKKK